MDRLTKEALIEAQDQHATSVYEALERIHDPEGLREILNDQFLAKPLAECFQELQEAGQELAKINAPALTKILTRIARMERAILNIAVES